MQIVMTNPFSPLPGKVRLAREIRSKTTMPLAWIAERLWMGKRGYLAWLLSRHENSPSTSTSNQAHLQI